MVPFIIQQSSFVVPAIRFMVPGVFMPGTFSTGDEGSASLKSKGTHGRLSDKKTVNAGSKLCEVGSY